MSGFFLSATSDSRATVKVLPAGAEFDPVASFSLLLDAADEALGTLEAPPGVASGS